MTAVLAVSLDGKIADRQRGAARFGSPRDLAHLATVIATMDAVLVGSGTLRAYGTSLVIRDPELLEQRRAAGRSPQPVHLICSPSGQLNPQWRFFQQPFPRWLLTTATGAAAWGDRPGFERQIQIPQDPPWFWPKILATLPLHLPPGQSRLRLGLLGGSSLVTAFLGQGCLDELHLTFCPLLLGGQSAVSLVGGAGFLECYAPRLQLLDMKAVDSEIFAHYRVADRGRK